MAVLCAADTGGAGAAAMRMHQALVHHSACDSRMYVLRKRTTDPSISVLPVANGDTGPLHAAPQDHVEQAWKAATESWKRVREQHPSSPPGMEQFSPLGSVVPLERIAELGDADIIHLHWVAGMLDEQSARKAFHGKPVVWTLHDLNPLTGGCHYSAGCDRFTRQCGACPLLGSQQENDLSRRMWEAKKRLYGGLDLHIVVLNRWMEAVVRNSSLLGEFPVHRIPNSVPLDVFQPGDRGAVRNVMKLQPQDKLVLFGADAVGNLRKGFDLLKMALDALKKSPVHERIVLGVFGRLTPNTELPQGYRTLPLGSIDDPRQLAQVYSAADVFCLPSLEDNLPNTLLEAMACGTPSVAFGIGGIPDILDHRKTGYVAQPFEVEDFAKGIEWVVAREEGFAPICRSTAETRYAPQVQANALEQLYNDIAHIRQEFTVPSPVHTASTKQLDLEPEAELMANVDSDVIRSHLDQGRFDYAIMALLERLDQHRTDPQLWALGEEICRRSDEWVNDRTLGLHLFLVAALGVIAVEAGEDA